VQEVFIATPSYDEWVSLEYSQSLFETGVHLTHAGIGVHYCLLPGNPFLDMARNNLVAMFLESTATDLLFIDADVGWDPLMVRRVLAHPQEIVGGLVPKRDAKVSPDGENIYHQNALTGKISEGYFNPDGGRFSYLFEAKEIPTAFLRIKRSAFDRLKANGVGTELLPWFKIGSKKQDFGEDIYFCRRWAETGESMWVDADMTFTHRGGRVWKGNFFDHCVATGVLKQEKAA